jgi:hypothetical protein
MMENMVMRRDNVTRLRPARKRRRRKASEPAPAADAPGSTFQLLDKDGAPAKDPQSVVAIELRDAAGNVQTFPFEWTICGSIGHAWGSGMNFG